MAEEHVPDRLRRILVLLAVSMGTFVALLDLTIVNVALPNIMTSLGVNVKQIKWVATAFMIASAVGMPLTGFLGRRFGLGRLFLAELAIFTAGSALCAAAWSLEMLVFSRVVQALGAGAIMPTSMALITETFPPHERGRAMGVWGIGFMIGPAIGPTTGGVLTDWFDWRAIFAINLPLGALILLLALVSIRPGQKNPDERFDWSGYLALTVFLVAGLLTIDSGQDEGWDSGPILFGFALTAAALMLFLALCWNAPYPVVPMRLFRNWNFGLAMLLGFLRAPSMFGAFFLLPIFLQNVQGRDTIDTGLLLVPTAITVAIGMWVAGMATDRFGPRWPTVFGFLISAYSMYLYQTLDPMVDRWAVIYPQLWRGLGVALLITPVNTAAMNAVGRSDAGNASWMINLVQAVGGATTIALLGTLLYRDTITQMDLLGTAESLRSVPPPHLVREALSYGYSVLESGQVFSALLMRQLSQAASTLAFQNLYILLALSALLGVVPALMFTPSNTGPGGLLRGALPGWAGLRGRVGGWRPYRPPLALWPSPVSPRVPSPPASRWDAGQVRRVIVMGTIMVGPFMALLEGSVVNVAVPSIMTTFGANIDQVKWVNTAFLLSSVVGMPMTGWLGRRIGLGRTYLLEMGIFVTGSALNAVAWSLDMLIMARVLQAIGAGSLMPTSLAIVTNLFPPHERGKAIGIWGIGFILAPAFGPTIGGVLIEWIDWRAIFAINIPLGLLSMLVAAVVLDRGEFNPGISFDWRGYLALAVFLVAGLLTMEQGNEEGWSAVPIQLGALLSVAAFLLFLVFSFGGGQAILPPRVFRNPDFTMATWLGCIRATGLFCALFMMPIFLQTVQGRTPIETGLLMMPAPVLVALTMPIAGILTDRFGPRWLTVCGVLLLSYSLYLFSFFDPLTSRWGLIYPQIFRGVGLGLLNTPVNTTAMNSVDRDDAPVASWVITLTRMFTASAIIALIGTLLPAIQTIELERLGGSAAFTQPPPPELVSQSISLGFAPAEAEHVARSVMTKFLSNAASTLAFRKIYLGFALAVLSGLIPALLMLGRKRG